MNEVTISQLGIMTQDEIIAEAQRRGYTIWDVFYGKWIGGSKMTSGPDKWMNAANNRLWQLQKND